MIAINIEGETPVKQAFSDLLTKKSHPRVVQRLLCKDQYFAKSDCYLVNGALGLWPYCNLSCTEFFEIPLTWIRCFDYGWDKRNMQCWKHLHIANHKH